MNVIMNLDYMEYQVLDPTYCGLVVGGRYFRFKTYSLSLTQVGTVIDLNILLDSVIDISELLQRSRDTGGESCYISLGGITIYFNSMTGIYHQVGSIVKIDVVIDKILTDEELFEEGLISPALEDYGIDLTDQYYIDTLNTMIFGG